MEEKSGTITQTDVSEIRDLIETCLEQARSLRNKIFELRNPETPDEANAPLASSCVGEEFKGQLRSLREVQEESLKTLNRFC